MKEDIKSYTLSELKKYLEEKGIASYCHTQVFNWLYAKRIENFAAMTDIPKETRKFLDDKFYFSELKILKREKSRDKTEKFLFELYGAARIESVLIPQAPRLTLCLSSQVGCKYGCSFCTSGSCGFKRNLTVSEIINQYSTIRGLFANKITNLVFMGIGEPLDNFETTIKAIEIFSEPKGLNFSRRRISLSTCGITPQIERLAALNLGVKLSVSLHSSDNQIRSKIMPVNRKYPLNELIKTLRNFSRIEKYPVTFEYALFGSLNTGKLEARNLIRLLKGINCKINLLPYNVTRGSFKEPTAYEVEEFCKELERGGLVYTLRKSRGQDIHAACGQLCAVWV